jgi:hypothetical protein
MSWRTVAERSRIRRQGAVGARGTEAAAGLNGPRPFRPSTSKAELREQAAAALESYSGLVTRCSPGRCRGKTGAVTKAIALVLVLIIGIFHNLESSIALSFTAKSHKAVSASIVLISNFSYDEELPALRFKSAQFQTFIWPQGWLHAQEVVDFHHQRLSGLKYGPWLQQRKFTFIEGRSQREAAPACKNAVVAANYVGVGTSDVHDGQGAGYFGAVVKEESWVDGIIGYDRHVADAQPRTMSCEELEAADCMLLLLNIGLDSRYEHLLFADVGHSGHIFGLSDAAAPSNNPKPYGRCSEDQSKKSDRKGEQSDGVVPRLSPNLPEGFIRLVIIVGGGVFFVVLGGILGGAWLRGLL